MRISIDHLRRIIKEEVARVTEATAGNPGAMPQEGDVYVSVEEPEYGGEEVFFDEIEDAGDLADFPDDMSWEPGAGPKPGSPGVWIWAADMTSTFAPGELVRVPEYDSRAGGTAWAHKAALAKIKQVDGGENLTKKDEKILKMLGRVTTYGTPSLNSVKAFSIRLRKDSIAFNYDPAGRGITGVIMATDLRGTGVAGLPELAQWMFDHGARKIAPQKRRPATSYYD